MGKGPPVISNFVSEYGDLRCQSGHCLSRATLFIFGACCASCLLQRVYARTNRLFGLLYAIYAHVGGQSGRKFASRGNIRWRLRAQLLPGFFQQVHSLVVGFPLLINEFPFLRPFVLPFDKHSPVLAYCLVLNHPPAYRMPIFSSLGMKRSDTAASNAGATTESPKSTLSALTPAPRPHKHRRDLTPEPKRVPSPPSSPEDSPTRDLAAKRVGERSLTPYPPPMYAPRVSMGNRSVTPYPGLRRWSSRDVASGDADTQASIRSSSPDKNELFDRSSAQSPTPSLKKGIFDGEVRVRTLSNCSTDSRYTFGVPTNSPRSVSRSSSSSDISVLSKASQDPMTPPMIARALGARLFEIEVTRRCKELTKMTLADATDAYADRLEGVDIACPPNTPASREAHDN